jgi:hypothetical protein
MVGVFVKLLKLNSCSDRSTQRSISAASSLVMQRAARIAQQLRNSMTRSIDNTAKYL